MHYMQPHQFEPLLPRLKLDEMRLRARAVIQQAYRLSGCAHPTTIASVQELVREMNSYYSNRIEGQSTHTKNIERALHQDFSNKPEVAQLQRIAIAHIEAERELESLVQNSVGVSVLTSSFISRAHAALYGRLVVTDRTTDDGRVVQPGLFRTEQVSVGRHEPPPGSALPGFLSRFDAVYPRPCAMEEQLITIAAAHGLDTSILRWQWSRLSSADALCFVPVQFRTLVGQSGFRPQAR